MDIILPGPALLNLSNQPTSPPSHSCSSLTTLFIPFRFSFPLASTSPTTMHPAEFCESYIMASLGKLTQTQRDGWS